MFISAEVDAGGQEDAEGNLESSFSTLQSKLRSDQNLRRADTWRLVRHECDGELSRLKIVRTRTQQLLYALTHIHWHK